MATTMEGFPDPDDESGRRKNSPNQIDSDSSDNENPDQASDTADRLAQAVLMHDDTDCEPLTDEQNSKWAEIQAELQPEEGFKNATTELERRTADFDKKNESLNEILTLIAGAPDQVGEAMPSVNNRTNQVARAWCGVLSKYEEVAKNDAEEYLRGVISRYLHYEKKRIDFYTSLNPELTLKPQDYRYLTEAVESFVNQAEFSGGELPAIHAAVEEIFEQTIVGEITLLINSIADVSYKESQRDSAAVKRLDPSVFGGESTSADKLEELDKKERLKRKLARFGDSALRATEIAAGVFLGVTLAAIANKGKR